MKTFGKFVGINTGVISNCYSCLKAKFPFAGKNTGEIVQDISDKFIWQKCKSKKRPLMFVPENWHSYANQADIWQIGSRKEFLHWAQLTLIGDKDAINANIKLTKNINLRGKKWQAIPNFKGTFNGNDKRIINFKGDALFSNNSGKIYNLIVDSINNNKENIAGFVLKNHGVIECCGAVCKLVVGATRGRPQKSGGGFALENHGCIDRCYSAGRVAKFIVPLWLKILIPLLIAAGMLFYPSGLPYKPMPYDRGQQQFEEGIDKNQNSVSFQFNMKAEISLRSGLCKIDYINTGESQKNVVVEVQITDADCYLATGVLAISPGELKELADGGNYDPYKSWTTIARSNLIRPGNKLESCKITTLYGGKYLPPGQYNGRARLVYYHPLTHNREIIENSFMLAIEVR